MTSSTPGAVAVPQRTLRRAIAALGLIIVVAGARTAGAACDLDTVRARVAVGFPGMHVAKLTNAAGIVTVLLATPDGGGIYAIALNAQPGQLATSHMTVRLDPDVRARAEQCTPQLFDDPALQAALLGCREPGTDGNEAALRAAIERALADQDRGPGLAPPRPTGTWLLISALAAALALIAYPARSARRALRGTSIVARRDAWLLAAVAVLAVGLATALAVQMSPEGDEVVTLGTGQDALSFLVSWEAGGEPFNPPGAATLFGLWLRLAEGVLWARALSIALIPLTVVAAYVAGAAWAGRIAGISLAALVALSPAYIRLAAIARAYALVGLATCVLMAAIAWTTRRTTRGVGLGIAALCAVWASYLLWPAALAAPWVARLARRDRWRLTAGLGLMAITLVPRIVNGLGEARAKTEMFELPDGAATLRYVVGLGGQAPPLSAIAGDAWTPVLSGALAALLIGAAAVWLWRRERRALGQLAALVALAGLPILALLAGGHGIRDRHVLVLHLVLAGPVAIGLASLLARGAWRPVGVALACILAVLCAAGNAAVLRTSADWPAGLAALAHASDLVVIMPRAAQGPVHAMLFGRAPQGGETAMVDDVCPLGTERWCRRADGMLTLSVDTLDDAVQRATAGKHTLWVFDVRALGLSQAPALRGCETRAANASWRVVECLASS